MPQSIQAPGPPHLPNVYRTTPCGAAPFPCLYAAAEAPPPVRAANEAILTLFCRHLLPAICRYGCVKRLSQVELLLLPAGTRVVLEQSSCLVREISIVAYGIILGRLGFSVHLSLCVRPRKCIPFCLKQTFPERNIPRLSRDTIKTGIDYITATDYRPHMARFCTG